MSADKTVLFSNFKYLFLSSIVRFVNLASENAYPLMFITFSGIRKEIILVSINNPSSKEVKFEPSSKLTFSSLLQPLNAYSPIISTDAGIMILVIYPTLLKALFCISRSPLGKIISATL